METKPLWYGVASEDELRQLKVLDDIMLASRTAMTTASTQKEFIANRLRTRYRQRNMTDAQQEAHRASDKRWRDKQRISLIGAADFKACACKTPATCVHDGCQQVAE